MKKYESVGLVIFTCAVVFLGTLLHSCGSNKQTKESSIKFTLVPSSESGLKFNNVIIEDDSVNLIMNPYAYMGSGVGVGDFNNDGLVDLFMGANQQTSRLFVNRGNFKFEDITENAGVRTDSWITGVNVVDVNGDGFEDIYLCASISSDPEKRKNKLYINNGTLGFREAAGECGLADTAYSSQSAFFDYDRDGDLDMYLLNHYTDHRNSNNIVKRNLSGKSAARDKLYRNNGSNPKTGLPEFEEVSMKAGINEDGYGLGVAITDANADGWPDIYVANDYLANDILWINNRNGTFTNTIEKSMRHQSYSSMGVDASDLNNDGLSELVTLDMMPEDNYRQKMMYSFLNYDRHVMELNAGYEPQYIRNMLQLNSGVVGAGDTSIPFYSEIGQLAGISETDWSWSVLMADLDNDGLRDMHITNGLGRDMINSDFINYFASNAKNAVTDYQRWYQGVLKKLNEYGTVELANYCFRNNGDLTFDNVSLEAGLGEKAISNGCAYADLDNDGDLDLVVNNINKETFLLRNGKRVTKSDTSGNYIMVALKGDSLNKDGLGSRIEVFTKAGIQVGEQNPARGYLSTVDKRVHFGFGNESLIDSVRVTWPDGRRETKINVPVNSIIPFDQKSAAMVQQAERAKSKRLVAEVSSDRGLDFRHKETFFNDFGYQQMLPQKYSQLGPFISIGDLNGDKAEDFFIGGATGQPGQVFIQQPNGTFKGKEVRGGPKREEDLGSIIFDADGDGDNDVLVVSGGNEEAYGSAAYLPVLYLNDGAGKFSIDADALPKSMNSSGQAASVCDYDSDGDQDVFIGGRIVPRRYPLTPESYLLRNNGGRFDIVTPDIAPELQNVGMVTASQWSDIDGDKLPDLVVAGEWMSIRIFRNTGTALKEIKSSGLEGLKGQWRSISLADVDGDGDQDIIAGNIGTNNRYNVSPQFPMKMYAEDFDDNGTLDPLLAYYRTDGGGKRKLFPGLTREQFASQVPLIKKKFLYNHDYAVSEISAVLQGAETENMLEFTCSETRSAWFENDGKGAFKIHFLPNEAQFAPVNAISCLDVDGDKKPDLVLAGNEYQADVMTGRSDASYGLVLINDGKGNYKAMRPQQSGLFLQGDVKDIKVLHTRNGERLILAAVNDNSLQAFSIIR